MVKHRKLTIIFAVALILFSATAAWVFCPRACFSSGKTIKTSHVTAYDETGELLRLAEVTDLPALNMTLTQLQKREPASFMKAYPLNEVAYEINGICDDTPFCIVLRKDGTGFIYHPNNAHYILRHPLVDAAQWVTLLDKLTGA